MPGRAWLERYAAIIHTLHYIPKAAYWIGGHAPRAPGPVDWASVPATPSPTRSLRHGRFVLHPRPPGGQRAVLHLRQPAAARSPLRPGPPPLLHEDPAGEPAPARGRRGDRGPRAHRG